MKPLTPAQQRVVDVMKEGVIIRMNNQWGWVEYVGRVGWVGANTTKILIRKNVIVQCDEIPLFTYYTLSPEYK